MSSAIASASATAATATASAAASIKTGHLKIVGVILAVTSGLLIGSSFVFKKKGLLASQTAAGEGVGYLKSWLWWTGMVMMIGGELCNFAAYAFVDAVVVTPLGALSVVICAILSSIFLKEKLSFFGWIGCFLCIVGSVIIALNGPQEQAVSTISAFQKLFFAPGFLAFAGVLITGSLVIIFWFAPKYGKKSMIWYISVCSMIGGVSVSCIQGLGAAIVTSIGGDNQFKQWFTYFLLVFVSVTLVTEIYYLNVALALFNTAMVTPTYYVMFTACTLITSVVLYQGLKATVTEILTVVMGFLVICAGIVILQMSKVDPEKFDKLDRRSTLLLKAARQNIDSEKGDMTEVEDPGIDALRGASGAIGSIIRARSAKRMSMNRGSQIRPRGMGMDGPQTKERESNRMSTHGLSDLPRHQLYDAPVRPSTDTINTEATVGENDVNTPRPPTLQKATSGDVASPRQQTIKFGKEDTAHYYPGPGRSGQAVHEQRAGQSGYPPIPAGAQQPKYGGARTAPATQTSFSSSAAAYADPFNTPPSDNPLASASLVELGHRDNSFDSLSDDLYDPPIEKGRSQGRRYPSGRDDDREEQQRLVDPRTSESPRPGGIRLLPTVPKGNSGLL